MRLLNANNQIFIGGYMLAEKFRTVASTYRRKNIYFEFYNDMVKLQPINFLDKDIVKLTNSSLYSFSRKPKVLAASNLPISAFWFTHVLFAG
jgi:hypothetical protein